MSVVFERVPWVLDKPLVYNPAHMAWGPIGYHDGTFSVTVIGGDAKLLDDGWSFYFSSGSPFTYRTRGKLSVLRAIDRGYTLTDMLALATHCDDPRWSAEREIERKEKLAREQKEWDEREAARLVLVASAKAKLTAEEFDAVVAEGFDR